MPSIDSPIHLNLAVYVGEQVASKKVPGLRYAQSQPIVKHFATLTGDFHSLSATDLKLMALAHTLLLDRNEGAELREKPSDPLVIVRGA